MKWVVMGNEAIVQSRRQMGGIYDQQASERAFSSIIHDI